MAAATPSRPAAPVSPAVEKPTATPAAPTTEVATKPEAGTPKAKPVPYLQLFRFATREDIALYAVGMVLSIGQGVVFPMFTYIFAGLLDAFFDPANFVSTVERYALYLFFIAIAVFVGSTIGTTTLLVAATNQARKIRFAFLHSVLSQEVGWHDVNHTGEVPSRLSEDVMMVYEGIGDKLANFVQFGTQFIAGIIMGFARGPALAAVVLSFIPLLGIAAGSMKVILSSLQKREADAYGRAGEVAAETISSIRTVAANGQERGEVARYSKYLADAEKAGIKKAWSIGASTGSVWFFILAAYAVGLYFGATQVLDSRRKNNICYINPVAEGCYSGGQVVNVFFAIIMSAFAVAQAVPNLTAFGTAQAAAARIYEVIERKSKIDAFSATGLAPEPSSVRGEIEFRNVTFAYPSRPEDVVLRNFSVSIRPGEKVALVGPSGCGKSTIIALLQRWYDPLEGVVLLDGHDLREYNVQWLRERFGLVLQEPMLFGCSIRQNIAYGRPGLVAATEEEIVAAARAAHAHSFIERLPKKYDSQVGERGSQLSGGQKQRVAIARAIIRNPRILLFDEATSALDSRSEKKVQAAIDDLLNSSGSAQRTSITIAHRLSTITRSDRIIVMRDGAILEMGTHASLMDIPDGVYRRLREVQDLRDGENASRVAVDLAEDQENAGVASAPALDQLETGADPQPVNEKPRASGTPSEKASADAPKNTGEKAKEGKEEIPEPTYPPVPFSRVLKYQRPDMWLLFLGLLGNAVAGTAMPIFSIVFSRITDVFFNPDDAQVESKTRFYMGMFFVIGSASFLGHLLSAGLLGVVGERLTRRLRVAAYTSMLRHPVSFFDMPENASGRLTTRLATDAALVKATTGERFGIGLMAICAMVSGLVIAFVATWQLSLLVLGLFPLIASVGAVQVKLLTGFSDKKDSEDAGQIAVEATSGIRTVLAFGLQNSMMTAFDTALHAQVKRGYKRAVAAGAGMGASMFVLFAAYSLCFWVGAKLIEKNLISFQDMLQCFFAIVMAAQGIGQASALATDAGKAEKAKNSIFALIDYAEEGKSPIDPLRETGEQPPTCGGRVEFVNVKFRYPARPEQVILNNFNLVIEPGQTVALVGPSGSGKSTIVQLLERFYDPEEGSVFVDRQNVKDLNVHWLRGQQAIVQQEPALWADSIAYNIEYGSPDHAPTPDTGVPVDAPAGSRIPANFSLQPAVQQAARDANAEDFITEFPYAYATHVGDRGSMLSGGQKQRVAIARAILRSPRILLLDEATSALDSRSEAVVQAALDRLIQTRGEMTKVIVAHRLSTIRNADKIVVLDGGQVVEQGTHDELMARNGLYAELARAQDAGMMSAAGAATAGVEPARVA